MGPYLVHSFFHLLMTLDKYRSFRRKCVQLPFEAGGLGPFQNSVCNPVSSACLNLSY
jgi:hypothetical protein